MSDTDATARGGVRLSVSDPALVGPALERLVSAAAVQAALPVDRLMNALAAVDAVVAATARAFTDGDRREFVVEVGDRRLRLSVGPLRNGQADELLAAAALPELGNVIDRVSDSVTTETVDGGMNLTIGLS